MRAELPGASLYGDVWITSPDVPRNCAIPFSTESEAFTSRTCVVQPPPAAKCGIVALADDGAPISTIGRVVIRNSPRSFVKPLSAIAAMGMEDAKVNVP